ncbi:MAG: cache domain-containing protein [Kiritimatiellia bacterium]
MLRARLFKSFAALVIMFGAVSMIFATRMVRSRVVVEAQNQVRLNLNSARAVFDNELQRLSTVLQLLAYKRELAEMCAARTWQDPEIRDRLAAMRHKFQLDFLAVVDHRGRTVLRTAPPFQTGDARGDDAIIHQALQGTPAAGAAVFNADELALEAEALPERAAMPTTAPDFKETRAMVLEAAVPIMLEGRVAGAIYGGILLNRNEHLVDKIRETVYRDETYQGQPTGSATVFLDDMRISTTIRQKDGTRALGTRAAGEVIERVLGSELAWLGRACIIGKCYLTAYEPIRDLRGNTIGMLYVGMLEKPFLDLQHGIIWRYALLFAVFIALALIIAYTTANRLARPLHLLAGAAKAVTGGNYPPPLPADNVSDETGILIKTFNQMTSKLNEREQTLKNANESLQATNRNYMEMLGFVSHELKSPVGTILNYVYLLNEGKLGNLTDKQSRAVRNIDNNIKLILEMIRHYLNLSRIENRELQPAPASLDVNADVLQPLLENYAPELEEHQITLDNRIPDGTMLYADINMTREVFENLISNAIKYGRAGGKLELDCRPLDRMTEISVKNEGEGIPADKLGLLFRKFSRLDTHRHIRHQKGTGLGLFITRNIVEAHGGKIEVESVPEQWTVFRFTLPADRKNNKER